MSAPAQEAVEVARASRHCAQVTREQAGNFYYGMALLPAAKRRAMFAVYAFARRVDDIGDGDLSRERRLELLDAELVAIRQLPGGEHGGAPKEALPAGARQRGSVPWGERKEDPVMVALADASGRYGLPTDALEDLIEGVQMDVVGTEYETFDQLVGYCRRVAGSIGRLSLAIFGFDGPPDAWRIADDLGVALQLTNILRDLREDAIRGRVYLPAEDFTRFGISAGPIAQTRIVELAQQAGSSGTGGMFRREDDLQRMAEMMRFQARRAQEWFAAGSGLLPLLDRRSAACVAAMSGIYRRLLMEIERHPERALASRMSLPGGRKAAVALHSLLAPGSALAGGPGQGQ